jgi:hypothetical protein
MALTACLERVIYRREKYQREFAKKELISLAWFYDESLKREIIQCALPLFAFFSL